MSALIDAEEEIVHLTSQIDAFNRLLPLIGQYGNDTLDSELSALEAMSHEALWGILRNCILDFKNLYEAVRDCKPDTDLPTLRNLKRKFSWVLERDQIQKFATRLANAKQNLTLALHVLGRTNELRALNMLSEVKDSVDSQERKVSEFLRSLERFLPLLEKASQEYNKSFERLEVESKTCLDDLSESMSSSFHFFQEEPAPETFMVESDGSQEVFAETKLDHSEGDDFEPKERRSS
ncbi:hypothetical protein SLS56_010342 [Neofusicoccum ribis]|uniref:Uncharacterized protein n=1 Tax=Neofusicoccum ribis TaxID=45134 RepID=A0ABR3SES2_9PEZI